MRTTHPSVAGVLLAAGLMAAPPAAAQSCPTVMDPARLPVHGATLTMAPASYRIGTTPYTTNVYNGQFVAPTLTMQPGERMDLSVVNNMRQTSSQPDSMVTWTNQHYHGLVVTPDPNGGDNVTHVRIPNTGPTRRPYDFLVPSYHTQGMFWYHPHPHGLTGSQVAGGLSGALMVGSILAYFPQYQGVRERTLLIRDMSFTFQSPTLMNINGSPCATLPVAEGERQLWNIGNFGANHFVNLKLEGMKWTLLALDGNPLARAETVDSLFIPPGSRAQVIVTGPRNGQRVRLTTTAVLPDTPAVATLGWLVGTPRRVSRVGPEPAGLDQSVADTLAFLREATEVNRETFRYSFPASGGAAINDTLYAPNHPPVNVPWGQVQEWTIVNETGFLHTFHIHQTDFLVMSVNGRPANEGRLRDNVTIGVHRDRTGTVVGDTVVVRFVFEPIAAGPFVFHCHVLQHEDEGMMHNVCVYDPRDPNGAQKCTQMFTQNAHSH